MTFTRIAVLGALCVASPAFAAPKADLSTSMSGPAGIHVYELGTYNVVVSNIGNAHAQNVTLSIQMPTTHTSPQVYVMGDLGTWSASCAPSGTRLDCNLGTINKNQSSSVFFEIALPESTAALQFTATAATSTAETTLANNSATLTASPLNYDLAVNAPRANHIRHCTGTGLTAFYECTLFPGSISTHDTVFNLDNTITFIGVPPNFTGSWSQPDAATLSFQYYDSGQLAADFTGLGVDGNCFEGITTFPGSPYVSPYEVCLQ